MKSLVTLAVAILALSPSAATFPKDNFAIVHVLSRTGFGPRPGDLERVRAQGIQRYLDDQLHPERLSDAAMAARLAGLTTIGLSSRQIADQYELPQIQARLQRKANANNNDTASADVKSGTTSPSEIASSPVRFEVVKNL